MFKSKSEIEAEEMRQKAEAESIVEAFQKRLQMIKMERSARVSAFGTPISQTASSISPKVEEPTVNTPQPADIPAHSRNQEFKTDLIHIAKIKIANSDMDDFLMTLCNDIAAIYTRSKNVHS